jgi:hypothetical protein
MQKAYITQGKIAYILGLWSLRFELKGSSSDSIAVFEIEVSLLVILPALVRRCY